MIAASPMEVNRGCYKTSRAHESNNDLTSTALAADGYGLSNRAVAAVINGFQIDIGRMSSGKTKLLVDPKKV